VVGVVGNVRESIFGGKPQPHVYAPFRQEYHANMHIHLKLAGMGPEAEGRMLETVRREIRATDEALPLLALRTMRGNLESSAEIWIVRTGARMLGIFGSVALFLAVIGLYAVSAQTVARRTREIGIRMALGANSESVRRMILGESLRVIAVGVGIGLALSIGIGRLLANVLYDIHSTDPVVLTVTSLILISVALFASYMPARRASRVDPLIALRSE
jgi:ABC-type antimicrobial peptide transport system permease subunit